MKTISYPALKFNWLAKLFSHKLLDKIPYPQEDQTRVEHLAQLGIVVYVHRSRGIVWHLALNQTISENNLPVINFTGGLKTNKLRPWLGISQLFRRRKSSQFGPHLPQEDQLDFCIKNERAAEIFLRKPFTLLSEGDDLDLMIQLVNLQKNSEKSIFLVPHVLVFRSEPSQFEPTTADLVFGTSSEPGFLRSLARVIFAKKTARWEVCREVNLKEFIAQAESDDAAVIAKKARSNIFTIMDLVERACHGPPLKSYSRMLSETMRDSQLQSFINESVQTTGIDKSKFEHKATKYFQEIAARFDMDITRIVDRGLWVIWNRIYDGMIWEKSDINRLRKKAHQGPLIITPSHRSHVDYLVMSQLLYSEGLMPPHIAAGNNLSFFPLGWLLRKGGAYFIRRSFKGGDPMYSEVLQAYLTRLFKEGFTQEFFIEGGRSRTGKTLSPKYGLLTMMVQSILNSKTKDVMFVPASISYERLVEEQSYTRELQGEEKKAETNRNILSSAKILRKRYGKVYVTFDDPISFSDLLNERGLTKEDLQDNDKLREFVKTLAHGLVYGINRCSIVTPTSLIVTALFTAPRRTLARPMLIRIARNLMNYIKRTTGELSRFDPSLLNNTNDEIDRALASLSKDQLIYREEAGNSVYYRIPEQSALPLNYYKNNIINHFITDAVLATAFVAKGGGKRFTVSEKELYAATQLLSQILKKEFIFPVGQSFDQIFASRIDAAIKLQVIEKVNKGYRLSRSARATHRLNFAVSLIANFIDAYLICTLRIKNEVEHSNNEKTLILGLLGKIRSAFLNGTVDCPEAANKSMVQNALSIFSDLGMLHYENEQPKFLAENSEAKLKQMIDILRKCHYNRLSL